MFKNIIKIGLALCSIYKMTMFAGPKLMAYDISVKTFTHFGEVLPVNGEFFMYFSGVVEALVAVLLMLSLVALLAGKKRYELVTGTAGNGLLFCTMAVALLCEFFVRTNPVDHLVVLGSSLLVIAVFQLLLLHSYRFSSQKNSVAAIQTIS